MKEIVQAVYSYYIAVLAVLVYLWKRKDLTRKNAIIVVIVGVPIILFAYYGIIDISAIVDKFIKYI